MSDFKAIELDSPAGTANRFLHPFRDQFYKTALL